jgi:hypothetical protein
MRASPADSSLDVTSSAAPFTAQTVSGQSNGLMTTPAVTTAATAQMIAWGDIVLSGIWRFQIIRRSGPGSGSTFRPRLGYVRMVPFSTRSKELPFPAPDAREGIEMPCGVLSRADRSDLDSLVPVSGRSSN